MNILVLGSHGLIGKNLCKFLTQKGYNVYEFDIKMGAEYDLRTNDAKTLLTSIINNIDYVFFLAFDVGGSKYLQNVSEHEYIENNLKIMQNVFDVIKNKPFIFASSQMENMYNSYGTLKRLGEHYTKAFNQISVRFWNVYGKEEYNEKSHVITDLIYKAKHHKKIKLLTNGNEQRQFLYEDDCSVGLYTIMINHDKIIKDRNIVHLTCFEWTSILEIAKIISKIYNCEIEFPKDIYDTLQTKHNKPNNYLLKYWKPIISLKQGITKLLI